LTHEERVSRIERGHPDISLARQCQLLDISRASLYYTPVVSETDQQTMAAIDRIYTEHPFYGSRRIRWTLADDYDMPIARERVQRLMRLMGLEAIYPRKRFSTSKSDDAHQTYPYLLNGLAIVRPNQVWGTDITYIKLETGWCYLVAMLDWFSRYVVSWRLSSTLELPFCIAALTEALTTATPEIFNSDQGSHFTSHEFTGILLEHGIRISMDGRGRCMDNIFTERLWRTIKYENVYLNSYRTVSDAEHGLASYFDFYNNKRRHQSLGYQTPTSVYFKGRQQSLLQYKNDTVSLSKLSTITV